jgi:hypothetical protein
VPHLWLAFYAHRKAEITGRLQKWRKRASVSDAPMGPKAIHSTVLTIEDEATIVAFRRHTLLPLDDCLYALQPTITANIAAVEGLIWIA